MTKRDRAERAHHRKGDVGEPNVAPLPAAGCHQRRDREGIERLVQGDGQKRAKTKQREAMLLVRFGRHRRAKCDAIDQRMQ